MVQGELGWWSVIDMLRLMYFGKLCSERSRIVKSIYRYSRSREERGNKRAWAYYTGQVMCELGLEDEWRLGEVADLEKWSIHIYIYTYIYTYTTTTMVCFCSTRILTNRSHKRLKHTTSCICTKSFVTHTYTDYSPLF